MVNEDSVVTGIFLQDPEMKSTCEQYPEVTIKLIYSVLFSLIINYLEMID